MTTAPTPKILDAGYHHDIPLMTYVRDPAPDPSLSTGTVCDLVRTTPRQAYANHPRLGGRPSESTSRGDIGSAVHAAILGGAPVLYAPEAFADWRKDAAKEFRDGVRNDGGIPLLAHQRRIVERAAEAGRRVLRQFKPGKPEVTMLWQQPMSATSPHTVWARGRADWLTDDGEYDIDVKTVDSADPLRWVKSTVIEGGLDVQHALRFNGHVQLSGKARKHLWLLVEIGRRKVFHAAAIFSRCINVGEWPGYGDAPVWASAPSWAAWDLENRGVA